MTDPRSGAVSNAFEQDKPGTDERNRAEAHIQHLRDQGGVFVEAVNATRMPMVVSDPRLPGNPIVFANSSFLELCGYTMAEVLGQQPHFMVGPSTDDNDARRFRAAIERLEDIVVETWQYRRDGSRFRAAVFCRPLADSTGEITNHFLSYLDVTRRHEAEEALRAQAEAERTSREALRKTGERFRRIVEHARDYAIFTTDPEGRITEWHEGAEAVFGWTAEEAIGHPVEDTFTPEDNAGGVPQHERETAREQGSAPDVRWHATKGGGRVFIDGTNAALLGDDGALRGFLKIGQDVTERHRAEEHQRMLLAELQHRVRNTLGVIRSIARRTAASSDTVDEMAAHLQGRIDAFARVQSVVTRNLDAGLDLRMLIEDELLAHAAREGEALRIAGPEIMLKARPAESISLAVHELTTNAVKYGALASDRGTVSVTWERRAGGEEEELALTWSENGIDMPDGDPERQGFGLELLRRGLPYELRAETFVEFRPTGLFFELRMPLGPSVLAGAADGA